MKQKLPCLGLVLLGLAVIFPAPVAGNTESGESIVKAVLSMLEAGLSEDVITAWLDSGSETLVRPSADQLIELQQAGASAELLKQLLERSAVTASPPTATETVVGSEEAHWPTKADKDSEAKESAASSVRPEVRIEPDPDSQLVAEEPDGPVQMSFTFSYSPWYLNEDEIDLNEESWDFFVYMDGIPVSYVPASVVSGMSSELEFTQMVEPGSHVVRVTLERHSRARGGGWNHTARVAEEEFSIEVAADGPEASLTVRFKENWGRLGQGPLEFSFSQGNVVRELEGVGGEPEGWPLICEEIEANLDPGEPTPGEVERELESCVRWGDLWPGRWAPPRDEVRDALAMFDFRPVPKGS